MAKRRFGIVILLLSFCLCLLPCQARAASTSDAQESIATGEDCALTIHYSCEGTAFPGQRVELYKVAEVDPDCRYTLTPSFASSGLNLNGIRTNEEWNVIRSTLEVQILLGSAEPVMAAVTDEAGNACFESLKPGLYFASAVQGTLGDLNCSFASALILLPGLGTDGCWQYQVNVAAKPEILPPVDPDKETELKVLKLWKDEGSTDRPRQIRVEIFRDGISYETIVLSEENHWSYSWMVKDDGADWKVIERDVPAGYTMTVQQKEHTFVLTNTWTPDAPEPPREDTPKTGDTSNLLLYTVLLNLSGMMLIVLGMAGKRMGHEKTN